MRVPAQHVTEGLVSDDEAGEELPAGSMAVVLLEDGVDQPRDLSEQPAIVAEEHPQGLREGEDELPVR